MQFCKSHWDQLRHAIQARGLADFVSSNGEEAAKRLERELEGKEPTFKTYDPLMAAHWMIANNALNFMNHIGADPLMMMTIQEEHPEWECPICCLNWLSAEHDKNCFDPNCKKERGQTFECWINRAADAAAEHIKKLKKG